LWFEKFDMKNFETVIKFIFVACLVLGLGCGCLSQKKITQKKKIEYMQKIYDELTNEIANEAEVLIIEDSVKVIFRSGILFNVSESFILEELYPCFNRFANVLNNYQNTKILITGHTDTTGERQANIELSQSRADNAKKTLEKFAVLESRMFTFGQGWNNPIDTNDTPEGRSKNRRVEFVILYNFAN
jgi:Outer membrane protein and related peptidoglycan-associated (lipo)proteins